MVASSIITLSPKTLTSMAPLARWTKLDAKDDQDDLTRSILDVFAVFTVWDEEINDEFEDIVNEEDDESEDLAEETTV